MFDPPISSGANMFIIIALGLLAAVAAIIVVDVYKNTFLKKEDREEDWLKNWANFINHHYKFKKKPGQMIRLFSSVGCGLAKLI